MCAEAQDSVSTAFGMPVSLPGVKTGKFAGVQHGTAVSVIRQTGIFPVRIAAGLMEQPHDNLYVQRRAALPSKRGTCEDFAAQALSCF
jgi:hypothetical protein